jgi:two-component system chemotaxis response regulator CheB
MVRFRCHVGHAWSGEDLRSTFDGQVEEALWLALRALQDQIELDEQLLRRAEENGREWAARRIGQRLAERRTAVEPIWQLLTS